MSQVSKLTKVVFTNGNTADSTPSAPLPATQTFAVELLAEDGVDATTGKGTVSGRSNSNGIQALCELLDAAGNVLADAYETQQLYLSANGGTTWTAAGDPQTAKSGQISTLHFPKLSAGQLGFIKQTSLTAPSTAIAMRRLSVGHGIVVDTQIDNPDTAQLTAAAIKTAVAAALTGTEAAVAADANVIGAIEVVHTIDSPNAATATIAVVFTHKTEITGIEVLKQGGAGGTNDTVQVKNGSTAITDAMDISGADKTVVRPTTIDDAQTTIAAGGTLNVTTTKASANNVANRVIVRGVRRA